MQFLITFVTPPFLTGNNFGQLGNIEKIPSKEDVMKYRDSGAVNEAFEIYGKSIPKLENQLHHIAKGLLENGKVEEAWKVLLSLSNN